MPSKIDLITEAEFATTSNGKKVLLEIKMGSCRATCTTPNWALLKDPKEPLAIDTEFQEFKGKDAEKWGHRMGRIAVVNTRGQVIYDVYVHYEHDQDTKTKMPPPVFGVTRKDLWLRNGAKESWEVEKNLAKIFHDRVIVGHGMRLDISAVGNVWSREHEDGGLRYDTQNAYGQVKLSTLAARFLGGNYNFHDPTEDAKVTMLLYLRRNPYEGRTDFKDPPLTIEDYDDEFPTLK